jgi:D-glycero-D-manno-heptose 1,7-bisphosphate phosphatase
MSNRAVFLDKDGTLVENLPYNVNPKRIHLALKAGKALHMLHQAGYQLVIVTNQSGVARGYFKEEALEAVEGRLRDLLRNEGGAPLAGFYYCPHLTEGTVPEYAIDCGCRKPEPGMLLKAANELDIDLARSWMVGDILNDVEAGNRAGCRTILIDNGNETEWKLSSYNRQPDFIVTDLLEAALAIINGKSVRKLSQGKQFESEKNG